MSYVHDDDDEHGDPGKHHQGAGHQSGSLIGRAQLAIFALPGFGHLQELGIAADEIALHADAKAVCRLGYIEFLQLPGEGMIGALWSLRRYRLDELQRGEIPLQRMLQELLGHLAG